MKRSFYAPIKIPPLSSSLSIAAKLIFHFLGHVFWFSLTLLFLVALYHGAVPWTVSPFEGSLEFRTIAPPFVPVTLPFVVEQAILGLLRLMALSLALAVCAILIGGALLFVLSVLMSLLGVLGSAIKWIFASHGVAATQPTAPERPESQRASVDWSAAAERARASQNTPLVLHLGALLEKLAKHGEVILRNFAQRATDVLANFAPAQTAVNAKGQPEAAESKPHGAWTEICNAFRTQGPPVEKAPSATSISGPATRNRSD